jgi:hypothetical protein
MRAVSRRRRKLSHGRGLARRAGTRSLFAPSLLFCVHSICANWGEFMRIRIGSFVAAALALLCVQASSFAAAPAQDEVAPAPARHEGEGPYSQLILRGVVVINGTGSPAFGPADVVIEGNRIVKVQSVGNPGAPIDADKRPKLAAGGREIDLSGHYVMPGIIDMHGHIGGAEQGTPAEYVYKLWLGNGITTVREPGCMNGVDWCVSESKRSAANAITAPRIFPYAAFGFKEREPMTQPEQARRWVREMKAKGIVGMKCFGYRPDILEAAFAELKKQGMRSACHHAQPDVSRVNVLTTARWGLTSMEHWYGLPEALFDDRTVQNYPPAYNYNNEADRFGQAGRLWAQAAQKGSDKYEAVIDELLKLDFTLDPTFTIYNASRDLMRAAPTGTTTTPCRSCGISTRRTATTMAASSSTGAARTRSPGARTTGAGWPSSTTTRTAAAALPSAPIRASSTSSTASARSRNSNCCAKPVSIRSK